MFQSRATIATLFVYLTFASAARFLTSSASRTSCTYGRTSARTTAIPTITHRAELVKRQSSSGAANSSSLVAPGSNYCGVSSGNTLFCDTAYACDARVFANGAYGYCSATGSTYQYFETTASASFYVNNANRECPAHVYCCSAGVNTQLFIKNDYAVTFFTCIDDAEDTTSTWTPYANLLNPVSFSLSLADAPSAGATSSSSSSSSAPPISTPTPVAPGTVTVTKTPKSTSTSGGNGDSQHTGSGSGLSSTETIGLGAGLGGGLGALALGGLIFFCWRRNVKKKDRRLAEVSPEVSPAPAYSPPMSYRGYNQSFAEQAKQEPMRQQQSYQSLGRYSAVSQADPRFSELASDDGRYPEAAENQRLRGYPYEMYGRNDYSNVRRM